jgi:hypothetical protein
MAQPTSPMRVLVAPHNFEIGGSQINALELACAVAAKPGFEVILYAPDGELTERARQCRATGSRAVRSQPGRKARDPLRLAQ